MLPIILGYVIVKLRYGEQARFHGITVMDAFSRSSIEFVGKGITINSHPLRNLVGLSQRAILAVRYGGQIKIGANSIILKGTTLGKNCVVGAGSVLCGSCPDNVIIAGNPAKIVKQNL